MHEIWVIIPVKLLAQTKSRLTAVLTPSQRAHLTQHLLQRTLSLLLDVPQVAHVVIVSRDVQIKQMAARMGAYCLAEEAQGGLNKAVTTGYQFVNEQKGTFALILPSDLAFLEAADVTAVCQQATKEKIIIAPDQVEEGTNVLLLPSDIAFRFQYGRSSYQKHLHEIQSQQHQPHIIHRPNLQFDLDTVQDFTIYQEKQLTDSYQQAAISQQLATNKANKT